MTVVTTYDQLPESVRDNGENYIPTVGNDLQHTYDLDAEMWQAHCTSCGEWVDNSFDIPATDFLCHVCEDVDSDDQDLSR